MKPEKQMATEGEAFTQGQIKSRKRVAERGEVFTAEREVNAMLDLVKQETERIDSRFLEPACGNGNFLAEILRRKLEVVSRQYEHQESQLQLQSVIALSSIYGIEIMMDNVEECRQRLFDIICEWYPSAVGGKEAPEELRAVWRYLLGRNILWGDALTLCLPVPADASQSVFGKAVRTELESHAYEFIHTDKPEKIFGNMKFDVIIGNPPYQLNVGVKKENYAVPIYHKFFQQAKKLNPRYITMIIPSRWFTGGRGLDDFRAEMLNDSRIKYIKDYIDSKDVFPGVDVSGGINYFLWAKDYDGPCEYVNVVNGKETKAFRKLNEYSVFPRYNQSLALIEKVTQFNEEKIAPMISSQTPFGFITTYRGEEKFFSDALSLYTSGGITFVKKEDVSRHVEWIDKYKVIFSKATSEHAGTPDKSGRYRVFSTMRVLLPNEICTQSYLVGGVFDTQLEAENYLSYLRTAFVRILMLPTLASQDISADKFQFVPLQDFSHPWTDEMLYEKYGLTDDEIAFIESMIRPME